MNFKLCILHIFSMILMSACTGVRLDTRTGKDVYLSNKNNSALKGCLDNIDNTFYVYKYLTGKEVKFNDNITKLCINPIDKKSIYVKLIRADTTVDSTLVYGHYREGYFDLSKTTTKFSVGPLLWSLNEQSKVIGISKTSELVCITASGGCLFVLFFPIMVGQSPDNVHEFRWSK